MLHELAWLRHESSHRFPKERRKIPPLPAGEGRGEGENVPIIKSPPCDTSHLPFAPSAKFGLIPLRFGGITMKPQVEIYDTTLRDGSQGEGINFSAADKLRIAEKLDHSKPFNKAQLTVWANQLLGEMSLPEKYSGFAAVMIGNAFWRRQFLATPFERRMLLLPHCLKHAEGCPAEYTEFGLDCERCGACTIADYKVKAEQLGYKVLVAEGSPIVLKIIVGGYVDGILGVACLNVLEKAIDKARKLHKPAPKPAARKTIRQVDRGNLHRRVGCAKHDGKIRNVAIR